MNKVHSRAKIELGERTNYISSESTALTIEPLLNLHTNIHSIYLFSLGLRCVLVGPYHTGFTSKNNE